MILSWKPDIVAAGHGNFYYFAPSKFRKIIKWARKTEKVIAELCATGDIEKDYFNQCTNFIDTKGVNQCKNSSIN